MAKRRKASERWSVPLKVGPVTIDVPGATRGLAKKNAERFILRHLRNVQRVVPQVATEPIAHLVGEPCLKGAKQRAEEYVAKANIRSSRLALRHGRPNPSPHIRN
jgi:hypothetical protein